MEALYESLLTLEVALVNAAVSGERRRLLLRVHRDRHRSGLPGRSGDGAQ
jgi:hypothetical protein